ncbi:unnamed protein product [Strongylus vulgaris]|uniref:Uncharacterized protein n=1 Tax=Strongylus vulgaris TaxID=40348 RepID=A0A3P7IL23_STRVU|nr:unnamed protein product [Strongylus vulgaris]
MSTALECLRVLRTPFREEITTGRILYGVLLASITASSTFMNIILMLIALFTDTLNTSLRLYLLSATFGGLVVVVPILSGLIPAILFRVQLKDPVNIIITTGDTLSYLILMLTTTAIAWDRFIFFLLPKVHKFINPYFAAFPCSAAFLVTIHMFTIGCYKRTDPFALAFTYSCRRYAPRTLRIDSDVLDMEILAASF